MHHQRSAWVPSTTATIVQPSHGRNGRSATATSTSAPTSSPVCTTTMTGYSEAPTS